MKKWSTAAYTMTLLSQNARKETISLVKRNSCQQAILTREMVSLLLRSVQAESGYMQQLVPPGLLRIQINLCQQAILPGEIVSLLLRSVQAESGYKQQFGTPGSLRIVRRSFLPDKDRNEFARIVHNYDITLKVVQCNSNIQTQGCHPLDKIRNGSVFHLKE